MRARAERVCACACECYTHASRSLCGRASRCTDTCVSARVRAWRWMRAGTLARECSRVPACRESLFECVNTHACMHQRVCVCVGTRLRVWVGMRLRVCARARARAVACA
eukprot:5764635-Pleurochrysis_carterae.AAC.3